MTKTKISVSWSGGKDSSMMLWQLLKGQQYDVVELHTAIGEETKRVSHHGVHQSLIQAQAKSIGIPLKLLALPQDQTNKSYEKMLDDYYGELKTKGIFHIGLGDIYLDDLKSYREELLSKNQMTGIYPLWKEDTYELANRFVANNFKSIICAAAPGKFADPITGTLFDSGFVKNLPEDVDPCGENGEFHSFTYDGPIFKDLIKLDLGDRVYQTYQHGHEKTTIEFIELSLNE